MQFRRWAMSANLKYNKMEFNWDPIFFLNLYLIHIIVQTFHLYFKFQSHKYYIKIGTRLNGILISFIFSRPEQNTSSEVNQFGSLVKHSQCRLTAGVKRVYGLNESMRLKTCFTQCRQDTPRMRINNGKPVHLKAESVSKRDEGASVRLSRIEIDSADNCNCVGPHLSWLYNYMWSVAQENW